MTDLTGNLIASLCQDCPANTFTLFQPSGLERLELVPYQDQHKGTHNGDRRVQMQNDIMFTLQNDLGVDVALSCQSNRFRWTLEEWRICTATYRPEFNLCTRFGEICSSCCKTSLPRRAWVLLDYVLQTLVSGPVLWRYVIRLLFGRWSGCSGSVRALLWCDVVGWLAPVQCCMYNNLFGWDFSRHDDISKSGISEIWLRRED